MNKELYDFMLNTQVTKYPTEYTALEILDQNEITKNVNFVANNIVSQLLCDYEVDNSFQNLERKILNWYDIINDLKNNKTQTIIYEYLGDRLNDIYLTTVKIWLQDLYFDYVNKFIDN